VMKFTPTAMPRRMRFFHYELSPRNMTKRGLIAEGRNDAS